MFKYLEDHQGSEKMSLPLFLRMKMQDDCHPHDDAIVITLTIANYTTKRVSIDNRSSADILYYLTFQQMRINKELLRPVNVPLI